MKTLDPTYRWPVEEVLVRLQAWEVLARLGANDDDAKLGANGDDAKVLPHQRQLGVVGQVTWGLGANVNGAKLCYLDANMDSVKPWVHFLKSFRQGHI